MNLRPNQDASNVFVPVMVPGEAARIATSAYVTGASLLVLNALPLLVGAIADRFHVGATQLGYVASAINVSTTVASLSAPVWVRRVSWSRATQIAVVLSIASAISASQADSFTAVLLSFLIFGGASSLLGVPAFASLGDTAKPGRSFSIAMFVQMTVASIWAVAMPALVAPRWGYSGEVLSIVFIIVPCLWLSSRIAPPEREAASAGSSQPRAGSTPALICGFAAFGTYIVGVTVFWYFVERLGNHLGISEQWIGLTVACASFSPVAGAAAGAFLSSRSSPLVVAIVGSAIMVGAYATIGTSNEWMYLLSASAWGFGWAMSHPMFQALIRSADRSNRMFTMAPAVMGIGGILGGTVGGHVIDWFGYSDALLLSAAFAFGACALAVATVKMIGWTHAEPSAT